MPISLKWEANMQKGKDLRGKNSRDKVRYVNVSKSSHTLVDFKFGEREAEHAFVFSQINEHSMMSASVKRDFHAWGMNKQV